MDKKKILDFFWVKGLPVGRMLSGSKTRYRKAHPDNEVCFNANVFCDEGKLWFGDIDLTTDADALQAIADETRVTLYVLRELDGRFDNENRPVEDVRAVAMRTFTPAKLTIFEVIHNLFKK